MAFVAVLEQVINVSVFQVTMVSIVGKNIMSVFQPLARMELPAETLSTAMTVYVFWSMKEDTVNYTKVLV